MMFQGVEVTKVSTNSTRDFIRVSLYSRHLIQKKHIYEVERLLKQQLRRPDVQDCLIRFGYPVTEGMDAMLAWLQRRARLEKGFPHEIGCFLGYPMEDVTGFIREKGRNCKCCGMWKVYGDEAYAKHLFEKYEQCSRALCNHLEQGVPFLHILAALPAA